jgi:CRP-like cAMP-binding protein
MNSAHDILIRKLTEHSRIDPEDEAALRALAARTRDLQPDEDLLAEDSKSDGLALVIDGLVVRYQMRSNGKRQYLSFHMSGDLPDAQTLFLERRDYALCSIGKARVGLIGREDLLELIKARPQVAFALWRGTLIDGAIVRATIANLGARPGRTRMAHLFCELYYRAQSTGIAKQGSCYLPFNQTQLGDALAMSLVTVNRTLQALRRTGAIQFRNGHVTVHDWPRLADIGHFDPGYLHIQRPVRL